MGPIILEGNFLVYGQFSGGWGQFSSGPIFLGGNYPLSFNIMILSSVHFYVLHVFNSIPKLELDQMIIKGLIDQCYRILHRDRFHIENVPWPDKVNFFFPSENGNNTGKFR